MNKRELLNNLPIIDRPINPTIELKMKHRLLDAKELGRICPEEIPNFIGCSYPFGNEGEITYDNEGIFEMKINTKDDDGNFEGTIKDCLGNASIKGNISDIKISFLKSYIPDESSIKSSNENLLYEGYWETSYTHQECFVGSWKYQGDLRMSGMFCLLNDISAKVSDFNFY